MGLGFNWTKEINTDDVDTGVGKLFSTRNVYKISVKFYIKHRIRLSLFCLKNKALR